LDLIRKNQPQNYFIIQIDNDSLLYEEILKMQFNNEFQNIHKMFDLQLDYSFSPFYDSLFFNMSILTDFFYDQIEKYLIQIFFHNHGIYIINKDACEYIHQILIEKFTFVYIESNEFFEKAIKDKKNKDKNKNILINDFKLKKIIEKNHTVDLIKSHRKHNEMNSGRNYNNSYRGNNYNFNNNSNFSKKKKNKGFSKNASGNFFSNKLIRKKKNNIDVNEKNDNHSFISGRVNSSQGLAKIRNPEERKKKSILESNEEMEEFDKDSKNKANKKVKNKLSEKLNADNLKISSDFFNDQSYKNFIKKTDINKNNFNSNNYLLETFKTKDSDLDSSENKQNIHDLKGIKEPFNEFKSMSIIDEQLKRLNRSHEMHGNRKKFLDELDTENNYEEVKSTPNSEINKNLNYSNDEKNNFDNMFNNTDYFSPIFDNNVLNSSSTEDNFKFFHPDIKNFNDRYKKDIQKQQNKSNNVENAYNSTRPTVGCLRRKAYYIANSDPNSSELNSDNLNNFVNNFNNLNTYEKWKMNQIPNLNNSNNNENNESRFNYNNKNEKNNDDNVANNFIESGSTNFYDTLYNAGIKTPNINFPNFETLFEKSKNDREINIYKTNLRNNKKDNLYNNDNYNENQGKLNRNNTIAYENFSSNKNLIDNHNSNKYKIKVIKYDDKSNKSDKESKNSNKDQKGNFNEKSDKNQINSNKKSDDLKNKPKKQSKIDKILSKNFNKHENEFLNLISISDHKANDPFKDEAEEIKIKKQNNSDNFSYDHKYDEENKEPKDFQQCNSKLNKDSKNKSINKGDEKDQEQEQEIILADKKVEIMENIEDAERLKLSANLANIRSKYSTSQRSIKKINFSTDELIYHLLIFSLEKLEEYTESLVKETDSLKGIYLELSEKERKDFFRRIHSLEVSMHIIFKETIIKKKFFKNAKSQFKNFNKLSNDFYFKNDFSFFLELMISKVTQLELTFEKMEKFLSMIKENYHIIIEDNTEKENIKLNHVIKLLTILTTIYAPMNIIPGLFGMNVKVPWQGDDNKTTLPFGIIVLVLAILLIVQLYVFRRLKWF
jgi:Mg2+ and Co2+ transporter CorA